MSRGSPIEELRWDEVDVDGPNVTSRTTLQTLAKMSSNAYYDWNTTDKAWYELGTNWTVVSDSDFAAVIILLMCFLPQGYPVGWEPDADGFRGHVFVSEDNATIVLAIKGTSAGWLVGGGGPTVRKDKFNGA
jgi:putative lipase involved disintegration of autophagic bodies